MVFLSKLIFLTKLSLFKCIFCIELYLNIVSNIYISIKFNKIRFNFSFGPCFCQQKLTLGLY